MTAPVYFARHALIWSSAGGSVRTIREGMEALPVLLDMALTERDPDLAEAWVVRLADLVRAVREAKAQERANPADEMSAAIEQVRAAQPEGIAA